MMYHNNISFAGAGRVAYSLCREFYTAGFKIDMIVSGNKTGSTLADSCNAGWSSDLKFPESTKVVLVAVPDHKLSEVLNEIQVAPGTIIAHTAGSFSLETIPERFEHKGIFYPLQTFSRNRKISFAELPVFIESSDDESFAVLRKMADAIGGHVYRASFEQRKMLHLAAVFVCNFTNHMLTLGKAISAKSGFGFEIFEQLIKETIAKALDSGPENSQTGPAVRNDLNTIGKHLQMLSDSQGMRNIYLAMTSSITEYYNKSH